MGQRSYSNPLTDLECRIVYATPMMGWDDLTTREATERCRLQMVASMRDRETDRQRGADRPLPIDLPAVAPPDDPTPIQAVTSRDVLLFVLAAAGTTVGGALALWALT